MSKLRLVENPKINRKIQKAPSRIWKELLLLSGLLNILLFVAYHLKR